MNTNIQRKIQVRNILSGTLVPIQPVEQDHPTKVDASEPDVAGKCDPINICIFVSQRTTQFQ